MSTLLTGPDEVPFSFPDDESRIEMSSDKTFQVVQALPGMMQEHLVF
jgi:hypothetical protein